LFLENLCPQFPCSFGWAGLNGALVVGDANGGEGGSLIVVVHSVGKQVGASMVGYFSKGGDLEVQSTVVDDFEFF